MVSKKDIHDFMAARDVLKANIEMFHGGTRELYRVIASELRKLTCDGKSTLLTRMFHDLRLHPVRGSLNKMPAHLRENIILHIPSAMHFDGKGGCKITSLFDQRAEPLAIRDWLDQPLFSKDVTIEKLIRSVADKKSAHSDPKYNETLLFAKSVKLIDEDMHKQHIVAIGEYVLSVMEGAIRQYPNVLKSKA